MMRLLIYRIAFWIAIAAWLDLAVGLAFEGLWRIVLFDAYIGFFFQSAVIFTIVSAIARPEKNSLSNR